jgi:hypothetical protein
MESEKILLKNIKTELLRKDNMSTNADNSQTTTSDYNEVARLRELLNRAIEIADKSLDCLIPVFRGEHEEIETELKRLKAEAKFATAPEEPVTQDESSDAVRYADYILNHYDRNSEKDKLCLANDLLRHRWSNGQPNALAPEEPMSKCRCNNPSIITATHNGDTYEQCSKCGKKFKESDEEMPMDAEIASIEWSCVHTARAIRYLRDEMIKIGNISSEDSGHNFSEIQKIWKEIQKLKTQTHYHHESYCRKCKEPNPEWRELGPDEVIQKGDEFTWGEYWHDVDLSVTDTPSSYPNFSFRTRRPLPTTNCKQISSKLVDGPKQGEMPMDIARVVQYCDAWADKFLKGHGKETYYARLGLLVDFATDLYRDEIQKLKEAK